MVSSFSFKLCKERFLLIIRHQNLKVVYYQTDFFEKKEKIYLLNGIGESELSGDVIKGTQNNYYGIILFYEIKKERFLE